MWQEPDEAELYWLSSCRTAFTGSPYNSKAAFYSRCSAAPRMPDPVLPSSPFQSYVCFSLFPLERCAEKMCSEL